MSSSSSSFFNMSAGTSLPTTTPTTAKATSPLLVEVDPSCPHRTTHHVYQDVDGSNIYDAHLYQTNLGQNNNKYYCIQLLESNVEPRSYFLWTRWGRFGSEGNSNTRSFPNVAWTITEFEKKFCDKTMNEWKNRAQFVRYTMKYTWVERNYASRDALQNTMTLKEVIVRYLHQEYIGSIRESTCHTIEEYLNRAARYHIVQAARGWNDEEVSGIHYEESAIPPSWLNGFGSESNVTGRHSIRARYPHGISPFAGKAFISLHSSKTFPTTIFPTTIIDQWYYDVGQDMTIPSELNQPLQRVRLEIIIQAILNQILPIREYSRTVIGPREVWEALQNPRFFVYLGCRLDGISIESTSIQERQSSFASHKIAHGDLLSCDFVSESIVMAEMNKQCWYHNEKQVVEIARQIVNNQRTLGPMEQLLRTHRIRPLQFLGRRIDPNTSSSSCRVATVTFAVIDSIGVQHRYELEYRHRTRVGDEYSSLYGYERHEQMATVRTHFLPSAPYRTHTVSVHNNMQNYAAELNEKQKALISALIPSPLFDEELNAKSFFNLSSSSAVGAIKHGAIMDACKEANVGTMIEHAILLTEFSRYGPSLYQDNHTFIVRRAFASAIIDAAMESSKLQLLPSVIVDLITEYTTFDLPFLEEEATEQMAQYPLVATHSNYPRHNLNPVEAIQRPGPIKSLHWDRDRSCVYQQAAPQYIMHYSSSNWNTGKHLNETMDEHPPASHHSSWDYIPPIVGLESVPISPAASTIPLSLPPLGSKLQPTFGSGSSSDHSTASSNTFQLAPSSGSFSFGTSQVNTASAYVAAPFIQHPWFASGGRDGSVLVTSANHVSTSSGGFSFGSRVASPSTAASNLFSPSSAPVFSPLSFGSSSSAAAPSATLFSIGTSPFGATTRASITGTSGFSFGGSASSADAAPKANGEFILDTNQSQADLANYYQFGGAEKVAESTSFTLPTGGSGFSFGSFSVPNSSVVNHPTVTPSLFAIGSTFSNSLSSGSWGTAAGSQGQRTIIKARRSNDRTQ